MKNQTPKFTSAVQAIGFPTFFFTVTAWVAYIAYDERDVTAGIASSILAGITGLAAERGIEYFSGNSNQEQLIGEHGQHHIE